MTPDAPADPAARLTSGDVVELILADHRTFEELLRTLRDSQADRDAARRTFATLHAAHAEAEEHAEGHEALLDVLEADDLEGADFDELVEKLAEVVNHHLTEEQLTILNPARDEVETEVLHRPGAEFAGERNRLIGEDCGDIDNVRAVVAEARDKGLLGD